MTIHTLNKGSGGAVCLKNLDNTSPFKFNGLIGSLLYYEFFLKISVDIIKLKIMG